MKTFISLFDVTVDNSAQTENSDSETEDPEVLFSRDHHILDSVFPVPSAFYIEPFDNLDIRE